MTNRKKYGEKILDYIEEGYQYFGVVGNTVKPCSKLNCEDCEFYKIKKSYACIEDLADWLKKEYEEPKVDWSKVAVDTPIIVTDEIEEEWKRRYFSKYENGLVYAFMDGRTSWSSDGDTIAWVYAKLWEEGMEDE